MLKKILIFLTALFMCGTAYAESVYIPSDVKGSEHEEDISLLLNLGIMENSDTGMFDVYSNVTRGEFCSFAARLLGDRAFIGSSSFTDIHDGYFAKDSIDMLTAAGCISDGVLFRPNDYIKYTEALKIIIEILGYGHIASGEGYPEGYINAAISLGLLKNVDAADGYVSKGDCASLLANALDTPVMIYSDNEYKTDEDATLLSELLRIEKVKGVVTSCGFSSITDDNIYFSDCFSIGGMIFDKGDTEPEKYLGRYAECYYTDDNGQYTAVYIIGRKNSEVSFEGSDFAGVDGNKVSFYSAAAKKFITLDSGYTVLKNGGKVSAFSAEDFGGENTKSVFIDNDRDGKYEVVLIEKYRNVFISGCSDDYIYSMIDAADNILLEKRDVILFEDKDGNVIEQGDISKGIASVYESDDKSLLRVVFSFDKIDGTISSCSEDADGRKLVIGSNIYTASKEILSRSTLDSGAGGTFYFDAEGKIAAFEKAVVNGFGYIMHVSEDVNEETVQIKMLTKESGIKRYKLAKRITIDGKRYTTSSAAAKALINPSGEHYSVVRYRISNDGEVSMLDTEAVNAANKDDVLSLNYTAERARFKSATGVFEGQFALAEDATMFRVPTDENNAYDDDYSVSDITYFKNDTRYYNLFAYSTDKYIVPQQVIVMKDDSKTLDAYALIGIVTKICEALGDDGEIVYNISVNTEGEDKSYNTKDKKLIDELTFRGEKAKLEEGDIIRYKLDGGGRISSAELTFDLSSEGHIETNPSTMDFHAAGYRYVFAEVNLKDGMYLEILPAGTDKPETHNLKGIKIYSFDAEKKKSAQFSQIDISEIYDRMSSGDACSKVFIVTKGGVPKAAYVYKGV